MKPKNFAGVVLLGALLLAVFGVTVLVVKAYRSPLGPALQVATPTLMPVTDEPAVTPAPTLDPSAVCGETAIWNVLVLGSDASDLRDPKGSDLTRLLRVDFPNKKVTIYAFPRDLWVDTAGLGMTDPAIDATRLGMVYYEARSRAASADVQQAMTEGTNTTARMLSKNFLVSIDHYVTIDLAQIPAMVDVIGGVPVDVPAAITDPVTGMSIPAGVQTLNGTQFAVYARTLPDSDYARIQRNNLLIAALREKLLDAGTWGKIPQLYTQFSETFVTDLSPEQINHLACLLKEVPSGAIVQEQVKQEWTSAGPQAGSLLWDKTAVLNQLKELGLIP
jgi:LCP family protein required for cell wall assembly